MPNYPQRNGLVIKYMYMHELQYKGPHIATTELNNKKILTTHTGTVGVN